LLIVYFFLVLFFHFFLLSSIYRILKLIEIYGTVCFHKQDVILFVLQLSLSVPLCSMRKDVFDNLVAFQVVIITMENKLDKIFSLETTNIASQ